MANGYNLTLELGLAVGPKEIPRIQAALQSAFKNLNIPVKINTTAAVQSVKKLATGLSEVNDLTEKLGISIGRTAGRLVAYTAASSAIYTLSGAIADATRNAIKFEYELAKIAQTVEKSNSDVQSYSKVINDISINSGLSNTKVAQTVRVLTQAGLSFRQAAEGARTLANTTLLASFDNLNSSTEAFIATMATFNLTVKETERAFGAINIVSKRYAVESDDLVEAIKRTGGVFKATGGDINELIALFTAVRSTTRESADTIATGFRTIFTRLQRPKTIQFFRDLGIELQDSKKNFIGNFEAIQAVSEGLERLGVKSGSIKFAQVVEEIGGSRQVSRVIPLLTEFAKAQEALGFATKASAETDKDVAKSKETLAFAILQLQQNFAILLTEISQDEQFQQMARLFINIANAAIETARAIKVLIPLMTVLSTIKLGRGLLDWVASRQVGTGAGAGGILSAFRFAGGGTVPGRGNEDTVRALLTPGEFVVNKKSAEAFGYENLGKINKYNKGGLVRFTHGGEVTSSRGLPTITSLGQADAEFQNIFSQIKPIVSKAFVDLFRTLKITALTEQEKTVNLGGGATSQAGGKFFSKRGSIGVNLGKADTQTIAHEVGHAADAALARTNNIQSKFASSKSGTFQNELVKLGKQGVINRRSASQPQGKEYAESNKQLLEYFSKDIEVFAEMFANADEEGRKLLTSTTSLKKGMRKLDTYIKATGESVLGISSSKINVTQALSPIGFASKIERRGGTEEEVKEAEASRLNRVKKREKLILQSVQGLPLAPLSSRPIPTAIQQNQNVPITAFPKSMRNAGYVNPFPASMTAKNPFPASMMQKSGGGFIPSIKSSGSGAVTGGSAPDIEKLDEAVQSTGTNLTGLSLALAISSQTLNAYTQSVDGTQTATQRIIAQFATMTSVLAGVISGLSLLGVELKISNIKNLFSGNLEKGITDQFKKFFAKPFAGTRGVLGSAGGGLINGAKGLAGGLNPKNFKFGNLLSAPRLAPALLAGGLAYGAGQLIDAGRGFNANTQNNIKAGNIGIAGTAAVEEANQKSLTNLAAAAVAVGAAFGPLGLAIGLATAGIIKFSDEGTGPLADSLRSVIEVTRDYTATLGINNSTNLIKANARAEAAINSFTKKLEKNSPSVEEQLKKVGSSDPADQVKIGDILSGPAINEIISGASQTLTENSRRRLALSGENEKVNRSKGLVGTGLSNINDSLSYVGLSTSRLTGIENRNKNIDETREQDKETVKETLQRLKPVLEAAGSDFTRKGGTSTDKFKETLPENVVKFLKVIEASGQSSDKILKEALKPSQTVQNFGKFTDALDKATKSAVAFQESLFNFNVTNINREAELSGLSSTDGSGVLQARKAGISGLITNTTAAQQRLIADTPNAVRLKNIQDPSSNQQRDLAELESNIAKDNSVIKQNIEARQLLLDVIKQEIDIEKQRTSAISSTLQSYATSDRAQRKQIERQVKVAELLNSGRDVNSLTSRQRQLVPEASKLLTQDQQDRVKRELEAYSANRLQNRGLTGTLGAGVLDVGTTGSTREEKAKIEEAKRVAKQQEQERSVLVDVLRQETIAQAEEFNRIAKLFKESLDANKTIDAIEKLANLAPIQLEFPTNFTMDLSGNQDLMSAISDQVTKEVAKRIANLKNGVE